MLTAPGGVVTPTTIKGFNNAIVYLSIFMTAVAVHFPLPVAVFT